MSTVAKKVIMGSGAVDAYEIDQSLIFNRADTAYMYRTPSETSNRRVWTISAWIKRNSITNAANDYHTIFGCDEGSSFGDTTHFDFTLYRDIIGVWLWNSEALRTNRLFRDVSAWYHVVVAVDTDNSTAGNRWRLYINGVEETSFSVDSNYTGDTANNVSGIKQMIGNSMTNHTNNYFNGQMAEFHNVDGQQLTPSSFGETNSATGQWIPKEYEGSYGTNGFYLKFASGALGTDSSGNGNNFTTSNLANADVVTDSPTNNCMTLNSLETNASTITEGSLKLVTTNHSDTTGTIKLPNTGKWYWEVTCTTVGSAYFGIYKTSYTKNAGSWVDGSQIVLEASTGKKYSYATTAATYMSGAVSNGDVVGVAVDCDNGKIFFADSNTWGDSGNPATGSNPAGTFTASDGWKPGFYGPGSPNAINLSLNFGQKTFSYTPPSGFSALTASNLSDPAIAIPSAQFNTVLYTGNGSTQSISGVGHQPDFVWIKNRAATDNHKLTDAVRGVTKEIESNSGDAEATNADGLTAFDSDGFSLGDDDEYNTNTENYVSWNWKANGAGSTDTSGDIDATVSANPTAGFSIVNYVPNGTASATVPHGLGVAPDMVFYKRYNGTSSWFCWTTAIDGSNDYLVLNETNAATAVTSAQSGGTSLTSSFIRATNYGASGSPEVVTYCFASKDAYSSIGSYSGNGSADGPMIVTGFRPAWVMIKRTDNTGEWIMFDNKRSPFNVVDKVLLAENASAEYTISNMLDINSNGFKMRDTHASRNASGGTYLYMAFAKSPFKTANAR